MTVESWFGQTVDRHVTRTDPPVSSNVFLIQSRSAIQHRRFNIIASSSASRYNIVAVPAFSANLVKC